MSIEEYANSSNLIKSAYGKKKNPIELIDGRTRIARAIEDVEGKLMGGIYAEIAQTLNPKIEDKYNDPRGYIERIVLEHNKYFFTIPEISDLLCMSKNAVYNMVSQGQIKSVRFRRSYRIAAEDLISYIHGAAGSRTVEDE